MTVCQVSGVLQTHDNYIRLLAAINHAGLELYVKAFHGTNEIPGGLGLPTEPDKLFKHLQKYQEEFKELVARAEITEDDYLTLFPLGRKETFSQEFSFPLFQKMLRMFDRAGSEATVAEEEEKREYFLQNMEKLTEIQLDKKLVKKSDTSPEYFEEKWNEIMEVLKSLNYNVSKLKPLFSQDMQESSFRYAVIRAQVSALLYECNDCAKTVKMNHLALERLKGNFQSALSESKEDNNNAKTENELKELNNLAEEACKNRSKIDTQRQSISEVVPNIKYWRDKNVEGDIIVYDECVSRLRDNINAQTRRVGELFNLVSFDIVHLKERAYSISGEAKSVDTLPRKKLSQIH